MLMFCAPIFPHIFDDSCFLTAEGPETRTETLPEKCIIGGADQNGTENNQEVNFLFYINFT